MRVALLLCGAAAVVEAFAGAYLSAPSLRSVLRGGGHVLPTLHRQRCRLDEADPSTACAAESIGARLAEVQASIEQACRDRSTGGEVQLVAVSKFKSNEEILAAYAAGQRLFGENYVQELVAKAPALPEDIRWHFIGMLQSNKAKMLVAGAKNLAVVESVHSLKVATALDKACEAASREEPLRVMVQVLTSDEDSKSGCAPSEVIELARHIVDACPNLDLCGLMTIGKFGDPHPEPYFELLRKCRSEVADALELNPDALQLSMGMSGDFEKAIRCGSTSVRVGTSIFGSRSPAPAASR